MSRNNGPVKGTIVLVCEETTHTHSYISEPCIMSNAQFNAMESAGDNTWNIGLGSGVLDDALGHIYFEPHVENTVTEPSATADRVNGAVKGMIVFVNADNAVSAEYIIEPIVVTEAQLNSLLNPADNSWYLQLVKRIDALGHTYFKGDIWPNL